MSDKKTNITVQEAFGAAINNGNLGAFTELVAADCVDHDPAPGQERGPAGYEAMFTEMRTAFPDMHVEVDHLVADDENVAFAYTLTGTHQGSFQGHEATGKSISVRGMQISRFADAKMVERWGSTNELGLMQQLGFA